MKRQLEYDKELSELTEGMSIKGSPVEVQEIRDCTFIEYDSSCAEEMAKANPMEYMFLAQNHETSKESNFLEQARKMIDITIETFDLIIRTRSRQRYPHIDKTLNKIRAAKEDFKYLVSLDRPVSTEVPAQGEPMVVYFGYEVQDDHKDKRPQVYNAICEFLLLAYIPFGSWSELETTDNVRKKNAKKSGNIFANYEKIDLSKQFGMAKTLADALGKAIKHANRGEAEAQYTKTRIATFKTSDKDPTELSLDSDALGIRAADKFGEELMRIKDAKVLQTYMALTKYSNIQNSYQFYDIPISKIMEIVLARGAVANFNTKERQRFSRALQYLAALTITIGRVEKTDKKGKVKPSYQEEKGVKLFRMIAEHPIKREFLSVDKDKLEDKHFDKTVITRFSGELLPNYNKNFTGIAAIYNSNLIAMDANKDETAVVLGFELETRFNQKQDKSEHIGMDRAYLIKKCEYTKTDQAEPSKATKMLRNVLDKLITNGILSKYEDLSNDNKAEVRMYPPLRREKQKLVGSSEIS